MNDGVEPDSDFSFETASAMSAGRAAPTREAASEPVTTARLGQVLKDVFGYDTFRPFQESIIRDTLAGRDVFALLPTGGGKSLCYQLPALVRPGLTVVISPLIALMKDQVESMEERGFNVRLINSTQGEAESRRELEYVLSKEAKILYVTPERFSNDEFMRSLRRADVSLLVVDEAHCLSEWGHDFRPSYLRLGDARRRLGNPPALALTATATPRVREDIAERLRLRQPRMIVAPAHRENLRHHAGDRQPARRCRSPARDRDPVRRINCARSASRSDPPGGCRADRWRRRRCDQ